MILVISTCQHELSENEFVKPVTTLLDDYQVKHYVDITSTDIKNADRIIICGTALHDNAYLDQIHKFRWLKSYDGPVLGICSGMQIIALVHGAKLKENTEIGMIKVKTLEENPLFSGYFEAYAMHSKGITDWTGFDLIAESDNGVEAIRKWNQYGLMFHPEVRNKEILTRFCNMLE